MITNLVFPFQNILYSRNKVRDYNDYIFLKIIKIPNPNFVSPSFSGSQL